MIADNSAYCTQVAQDALNLLEARHGVRGENQIMMQSFTDVSSQFDSILSIITVFLYPSWQQFHYWLEESAS